MKDEALLHQAAVGNIMYTVKDNGTRRCSMQAIEFQAQVKNGTIEIPEIYREELTNTVRVIILTQPRPTETGLLAHLLANPINDDSFTPLSRDEIYADRVR